jgi:peptidoglycan/LPS O-acetylase OafA/YrhL
MVLAIFKFDIASSGVCILEKPKVSGGLIYGIDLLRFVSATIVMVYHFTFWHSVRGQSVLGTLVQLPHVLPIRWDFGWVGVEIFFVISGVVISRSASNRKPAEFLMGRIMRLVPGAWFCATYSLVIFLLVLKFDLLKTILGYFGSVIFWPFLSIDGVYWTLGIEIDFYLIVYLLMRTGRIAQIELVMLCLGATSGFFWVALLSLAGWTQSATGTGAVVHMLVLKAEGNRILQLALIPHGCLFALGVLLDRAASSARWRARLPVLALLAAGSVLEIIGQNSIIARASGLSLSPLTAVLVWTAAVLFISASLILNDRVAPFVSRIGGQVATLGKLTYPLYLTHNATVFLVVAVLGPLIGAWSILAGMSAALLVAFLIQAGPEGWVRQLLDRALRNKDAARRNVG